MYDEPKKNVFISYTCFQFIFKKIKIFFISYAVFIPWYIYLKLEITKKKIVI